MTVVAAPVMLFDHVDAVLRAWSARLGLAAQSPLIASAFRGLCRESLALPAGRRPLQASRLNADGTPFQFALALGAGRPWLQFLAEAAPPGSHGAARLAAATHAMRHLAAVFGASAELARVRTWLAALAPPADAAVLADEAGALWLGAGFADGVGARMKVYVNARLGPVRTRWDRLEALAARFGQAGAWRALAAAMPGCEPLGAAVVIGAGMPPTARLYLTSQGRELAGALAFAQQGGGAAFRDLVEQSASPLLDGLPTAAMRALVASAALRAAGLADPKVELCAPWIFDSDAQAATRCQRWLGSLGIDAALYDDALALCAGGAPDAAACVAHAYVGVGLDHGRASASFYFNPSAGASRAAMSCR
ncbi:MAG: hypothetical protein ABJD97_07870 [Betaproteobacteria bacterium]